ncbi:CoA transferase [Enterovirga sp.]|uniref:CaiB/BaiF CoA transferase family protein n=1 Tax=Enterovirga sp. TaxID=2026350 RepID=UPI002618229F|nr:CoA transferase [Enterovirga sp.]MDB5592432.1 dehydratase [Enterovirga sp.]
MTRSLPLAGVVVVEPGARIGAAVCGSLLAHLGATVIVPEGLAADGGGKFRHRDQMIAGKLSVRADADMLDRLVARSDIVLLSSDLDPGRRPGAWPGAAGRVECDVTAFGDSGPMAGLAFSDAQIQALSGIIDTTGMADGPPAPIRLPIVEFMTGVYAAAACLSAWRVRRLGGSGQAIDMSLYDCAFASMATFLPRLLDGSGASVGRVGNRHAMASPWNVFQAQDGWVLVCAASDMQWSRICEVVGRPELAQDPRYLRVADRVARHREVDGILQGWIGAGSIARSIEVLGRVGIPCGPVTPVDGYPREANLEHRKAVLRVPGPGGSAPIFVPASPLRMSGTPAVSPDRIPEPDQDRAAVARLLDEPRFAPLSSAARAGALPLSGIRVLEIGHYTTAPLSARHLANLGADVIKIEPATGEAVRDWAPVKNGTGYFFVYTNADKRTLVLDLETADGVATLKELIARSDVLIENLKPGALAKRGCSAAEIARVNPRIVYCPVSGFGADTIYAARPAYDTVIQAMSGFMDLTRAGDVPVKSGISSADIMGAEMAVVAVLGALEARDRTGLGQAIDLSMQDVGSWLTMPLWNGDEAAPRPAVVAARDGFVMVETVSGEDVPAAIGMAPERAGEMSRAELAEALARQGRRAAPVLTAQEMLHSDQTRERGLLYYGRAPDGEEWPLVASPLRLKGTPPVLRTPMGALGSDGPAILAELRRDATPAVRGAAG